MRVTTPPSSDLLPLCTCESESPNACSTIIPLNAAGPTRWHPPYASGWPRHTSDPRTSCAAPGLCTRRASATAPPTIGAPRRNGWYPSHSAMLTSRAHTPTTSTGTRAAPSQDQHYAATNKPYQLCSVAIVVETDSARSRYLSCGVAPLYSLRLSVSASSVRPSTRCRQSPTSACRRSEAPCRLQYRVPPR
jgi:hypothetical protein